MIRKSWLRALVAVVPMLIILATVLVIGTKPRTPSQAIEEYVRAGYVVNDDNQLIWNIAQDFINSTRYENKLLINQPPRAGFANIYVLKSDPKDYFDIDCNCAYLGNGIIVCDEKLIKYFTEILNYKYKEGEKIWLEDQMGRDEAIEYNNDINLLLSVSLLRWIIGHEIGHLVLNHDGLESNFRPTGDTPQRLAKNVEMEADAYAIERISYVDDITFTYLTLSSTIMTLYVYARDIQSPEKAGMVPLRNEDITPITLADISSTHPPLLRRSLDMMELLLRMHPELDSSDFFNVVAANVDYKSKGASSPLLCQSTVNPVVYLAVLELPEGAQDLRGPLYARYWDAGIDNMNIAQYDKASDYFTKGIEVATELLRDNNEEQEYPS